MEIHCLVHPNFGVYVIQNVDLTSSVAQIRSRLFEHLRETFQRKGITEADLGAYKPKDLRRDKAVNKFRYVEDNYKSSEWKIPGGSGASLQSIVGQGGLNGDFIPLVFVVKDVVQSEITPLARPLDSDKALLLKYVTFTVLLTTSEEPDWSTVMGQNEYRMLSLLEEYISDTVRVSRRPASADMCDSLRVMINLLIVPLNYRIQISSMINNDTNAAIPYSDEDYETSHFIQAISTIRQLETPMTEFSLEAAWLLVLGKFRLFWAKEVNGNCTSDRMLPFPLIANFIGRTRDDIRCTYHPRPAFALMKDGFPSFLAEVDSKANREDLNGLRVQLACSLRLGLALQGEASSEDNGFFLMGAFFARQWEITRLFCYADKKGDVCFTEETYKIIDILHLMTFLFEFYNYSRHVQNGCRIGEKSDSIAAMTEAIDEAGFGTLTGKKDDGNRGSRGSKKRKTDGNRNQSQSKDQNKYREQITDALQKAKFKVQSVNYGPDLAPMPELPSHVVEATSSEGVRVIAKLVCSKFSDELSLLEELNAQRSLHNHVIPLIETLESSSAGLLMILPKKTSVLSLFPDILDRESVRLSRQLLEGVAFLHRHNIAHLDIKPSNLVWDNALKRLYIIDFDIAIKCKDVDEMVEMSCGTPKWSAPEIVHDDKAPLRPFNPIRADLWSCGAVLEFFGMGKDRAIDLLTSLLLDCDPRRRPLLHELVDEEPDFWSSGWLLRALASAGSLKRSCSNSGGPKLKRPELNYPNTGPASAPDFLPAIELATGAGTDYLQPVPAG